MALAGKKAILLIEEIYEEMEFWYPYFRLREEGVSIEVVGQEPKHEYHGKHGYPAASTVAAKYVKGDQCDILVIPGGYAPDKMRRHPDMVRLVKEAFAAGKVVASICHGPWMFAEADILRGRTVTSVAAIKTDLINAGAVWVDREVVVDGNLITSRTPADLPAFCRAIIQAAGQ